MKARLSPRDRAVVADLRRAWTEAAHAYPGDRAVDDIFTLLDLLDSAFPPEKFIEDGNYACGTVVPYPENQATPAEGWAIRGDLGGIHWGSDPLGNWAWRISDVADALADPAPVGLTEARIDTAYWREHVVKHVVTNEQALSFLDEIDRLSAAPVDDRERVTTTFHERTARRHDDGRHRGDLPVIGCAYCEMEHPKGRFRTLMAEREGEVLLDGKRYRVEGEAWTVQHGPDWDGSDTSGMPEGTYRRLVPVSPSVDPGEG